MSLHEIVLATCSLFHHERAKSRKHHLPPNTDCSRHWIKSHSLLVEQLSPEAAPESPLPLTPVSKSVSAEGVARSDHSQLEYCVTNDGKWIYKHNKRWRQKPGALAALRGKGVKTRTHIAHDSTTNVFWWVCVTKKKKEKKIKCVLLGFKTAIREQTLDVLRIIITICWELASSWSLKYTAVRVFFAFSMIDFKWGHRKATGLT